MVLAELIVMVLFNDLFPYGGVMRLFPANCVVRVLAWVRGFLGFASEAWTYGWGVLNFP